MNIVWGACCFNETKETITNFFKNTIETLSDKGYKVYPIIFDAKFEHNQEDIDYISNNIKDVLIIQNETNIFPNKNYGVAVIAEYAHRIKSDYLAIVDPDWDVNEYTSFINNLFLPLESKKADIVIPDIGREAGRSNMFIGKVAISLFYPEYFNIIKTAFPGSLIGKTERIYQITSSDFYHYDWGGEWDVISLAIENHFSIDSLPIAVKNVRHRSNASKSLDAYQIWKAIFSNKGMIKRYSNMELCDCHIKSFDSLSEILLKEELTAVEQIELVKKYATNETQKQLLYMVLYPLASILEEIDYIPVIEKTNQLPYDKEKIKEVSDLAIYCVKSALRKTNKSIENIHKTANSVANNLWSDWDQKTQWESLENVKKYFSKEGIV